MNETIESKRRALTEPFSVVDVPVGAAECYEQLGTKRKFWYTDDLGSMVLYKQSRSNTGEHWAEKVACELASEIGIPHAHYDLAVCGTELGVVSPNFVPRQGRLIHGNELFSSVDRGDDEHVRFYKNTNHTVKKVMRFLSLNAASVGAPEQVPCEVDIQTAADVFVGYLMLDAWIGNTDRHHENWAIYIARDGIRLAPSYDHASSLGRIERDERKQHMLETRDRYGSVEAYAMKARSAFYRTPDDRKAMLTLDAFQDAAALRPRAAAAWVKRLRIIPDEVIAAIFRRVPDTHITDISRNFGMEMLRINRRRIVALMEEMQ